MKIHQNSIESGSSPHLNLINLISKLGHKPIATPGNEVRFLNVFGSEKAQSHFVVNPLLDVWFDHETKRGGNLLDFALAYWPDMGTAKVALKIREIFAEEIKAPIKNIFGKRKRKAKKLPFYKVEKTKPLGFNTDINDFLQQQGILDCAPDLLREIYYYFVDEKGLRKDFWAVGWPNENGGWQVSCKVFKGCIGAGGMTFIEGEDTKLVVFESINDFILWKLSKSDWDASSSILIIGTEAYLRAAITRIRKFKEPLVVLGKEFLTAQVTSELLPNVSVFRFEENIAERCPSL